MVTKYNGAVMNATINIDTKPYIVAEVGGRAYMDPARGHAVFDPESGPRWHSILARCVGQEFRVRVIRQKRRRTHDQNALLWGVIYPDILDGLRELAESVGELPVFVDEDELHEAMKWVFLRKVYVLPGAGNIEKPPRSSQLSVAEFSEFVDKVKRWAAERNIWVREPGEAAQ